MIVRDVLKHPELLDNFDWFNDGKDTIQWLHGFRSHVIGSQAERAFVLATIMEEQLRQYFAQQAERRPR